MDVPANKYLLPTPPITTLGLFMILHFSTDGMSAYQQHRLNPCSVHRLREVVTLFDVPHACR